MSSSWTARTLRLSAWPRCTRPRSRFTATAWLSKQTAGTEHFGAPRDVELTHDDILAALTELAGEHNISSARVRGMLMLTAVRAGIGHSPQEEAEALNQVMLTLDAGSMNVSDDRILALSGRSDDTIGLEDQREAARDEAAVLGLTVTAAQRDKFAKSGIAMDDGAFPVHDATHLAAAKSEYAKGNLAGHSKAEVRAHINKNARRLGLPGLDDDDRDEVAATQETQAMALAAGSGGRDSASAVLARHPELAHLFKTGKTSSRKHPSRAGREVTSASRAHASDLDEDPTAEKPADAIDRYTRMREQEFGGQSGEAGPGNQVHPAKSAIQREAEERRSLAGGRPGGRSIGDMHPRTGPGSSGSVRA